MTCFIDKNLNIYKSVFAIENIILSAVNTFNEFDDHISSIIGTNKFKLIESIIDASIKISSINHGMSAENLISSLMIIFSQKAKREFKIKPLDYSTRIYSPKGSEYRKVLSRKIRDKTNSYFVKERKPKKKNKRR